MEKKCKNCAHFTLEPYEWTRKGFGHCGSSKVFDGNDAQLIEADPSGVEVSKNFGCIHFEKKEKMKK